MLRLYLPICFLTVTLGVACLATLRMPRWAGGVLVVAYGAFFVGAYLC